MIITIAGMPGSGKSVTAKGLVERFKLKHHSVGEFMRKRAHQKGMTIEQYNKSGETDASVDRDADEWQKELGEKEDGFVIDGRLSFHFIPNSIKILLTVDLKVAAERVIRENRKHEKFKDADEAYKSIKQRMESNLKRYKKYYDINPFDESQFDIVFDTTGFSIQEGIDKVAEEIANFK